jgi:hypothetical protein
VSVKDFVKINNMNKVYHNINKKIVYSGPYDDCCAYVRANNTIYLSYSVLTILSKMEGIKLIFESDNVSEQELILTNYIDWRNKQVESPCYCGHTICCDCGDPGLSEFKFNLNSGNLTDFLQSI